MPATMLIHQDKINWMPPVAVSMAIHVVFLTVMLVAPKFELKKDFKPSVIDVSLVSPKQPAPAQKPAESVAAKPAPPSPKEKKSPPPQKKAAEAAVAEKPAEPTVIRTKASLKKKTFKSVKVVENAIKKIEKEVEQNPPATVTSALERLQEKVHQEELKRRHIGADDKTTANAKGKGATSQLSGKQRADLIDIYRVEIAYQVQEHWAFSEQMAGDAKNLEAKLVFKVMPNGEIQDIFFTDRSGNQYLDESAYKAVMKSNPVSPHPKGIFDPFIYVGIVFGPEGVR